jgi:hypothetical protein
MSDETSGSGDSPERAREKRDDRREAEERETEQTGQTDRAGRDDVGEESVLEGLPGSTANKPTG